MRVDATRLATLMDNQLHESMMRSVQSTKKCAAEEPNGLQWTEYDIHRSMVNTMQDINNMAWGAIFLLIQLQDVTPIENYAEVKAALEKVQEEYHQLRLNVIDHKINLFDLINSEE